MKELSVPAKIYLIAIYCTGGGLFFSYLHFAQNTDPMMVIVLSLLASFFQIYKVVGATERSHYTFSFLIYGFTFAYFGIGELLVVILISNLAEWIWNRPPWFIQIFNISCYFIAAVGAYLVFKSINPYRVIDNAARCFVHCDQYGGVHLSELFHSWYRPLAGTWRKFQGLTNAGSLSLYDGRYSAHVRVYFDRGVEHQPIHPDPLPVPALFDLYHPSNTRP